MAKYQMNREGELARKRFFEIFGDLPEETQLKLIESLSKITKEARL